MGSAIAGTKGGVYDMQPVLNQPHPFLDQPYIPRAVPQSSQQPSFPPVQPVRLIPPSPAASSDAAPEPSAVPAKSEPVKPRPEEREAAESSDPPAPAADTAPASKQRPLRRPRRTISLSDDLAQANEGERGGFLFISEVKIGVLAHDTGPFSSHKEDGIDTNLEVLFKSPDFMEAIFSPRPHIGGTYATNGKTNQVYAGLSWEFDFFKVGFFGFSFGGAYHDGEKETDARDQKSLGCSFLFRESVDLGIRIAEAHSVSLHLSHISNAKLCTDASGEAVNEGLENVGVRYGYRF